MSDLPLKLNPLLKDVVNRTRQVGLHKVAAQMQGHPITLQHVVHKLGQDLITHTRKYAAIQGGLADLDALHSKGIVPLEKSAFMAGLARGAGTMLSRGWQGIGNMGARAGTAVAQRPVMQRMGRMDQAIAAAPGLTNAQRGAMTQSLVPAAEKAMESAAARGGNIGRQVAQGGALAGAGAGLGYMAGNNNDGY